MSSENAGGAKPFNGDINQDRLTTELTYQPNTDLLGGARKLSSVDFVPFF